MSFSFVVAGHVNGNVASGLFPNVYCVIFNAYWKQIHYSYLRWVDKQKTLFHSKLFRCRVCFVLSSFVSSVLERTRVGDRDNNCKLPRVRDVTVLAASIYPLH